MSRFLPQFLIAFVTVSSLSTSLTFADDTIDPDPAHDHQVTLVRPDKIAWQHPPTLRKTLKYAVLYGDPKTPGSCVVQRTKMPPNEIICPHHHSYHEVITVISGAMGLGMGPIFRKFGELLPAGSMFAQPEVHTHFAWAGQEGAIFQVEFIAPPSDSPRFVYEDTKDDPQYWDKSLPEPEGCNRK